MERSHDVPRSTAASRALACHEPPPRMSLVSLLARQNQGYAHCETVFVERCSLRRHGIDREARVESLDRDPLSLCHERRDGVGAALLCAVSGGPGESHPRAPSDPGVTVSRHRALLISPQA